MAQPYGGLLKIHMTPIQRECLEFLVTRRLNDLINARRAGKADRITEEEQQLIELKKELQQSGT